MNLRQGRAQRRRADGAVRQAGRGACRRPAGETRRGFGGPVTARHPRRGRAGRSRRAGRGQGPPRREPRGRADPDAAGRRPAVQGDGPGDHAAGGRGHGPVRLGAGQGPSSSTPERASASPIGERRPGPAAVSPQARSSISPISSPPTAAARLQRVERIVELRDGARADQRRGDAGRREAPRRAPAGPASGRGVSAIAASRLSLSTSSGVIRDDCSVQFARRAGVRPARR